MLYPNPPPPFPCLAFSEESAPVRVGGELIEGFVRPKKEAHFFRRRSQSTVGELKFKISDFKCSSPAVKILVGSKEKMDQCLRESGAGSSCLWTHAEGNSMGKMSSRQLKLSYRLRSEQILDVPVLNGSLLELSPLSTRRDVLRKPSCMKRPLEPESPTPSNVSSNSTGEMSPIVETPTREKFVSLVLPEKTYKHLVEMVSPGGIIREYQLLLRRLVESSNFLDLDFQLLDFQKWMRNHPFAAFLEENDLVVVRIGEGLSSLRWTLFRFDFADGLVRSTKGEDLSDLVLIFGDKAIDRFPGSRAGWWSQPMLASADKAQDKHLDKKVELAWRVWKISVHKKDSCSGPLTQLLFNVLGSDGMVSRSEMDSVSSLFSSHQSGELGQASSQEVDIPTVLFFHISNRVSLKEECALSHLRSYHKELKGKGLCVLLNLLLGMGENQATLPDTISKDKGLGSPQPDPAASKSRSLARMHADEEGIKGSLREKFSKQSRMVKEVIDIGLDAQMGIQLVGSTTSEIGMGEQSKLKLLRTGDAGQMSSECGILEAAVHRFGSRTERGLNTVERNSCRLKQVKCQSVSGLQVNHGVEPVRVMVWLNCGFLEALLDAVLEDMMVESDDCFGSGGFLNVEVAAEACLRVLDLVPKEGSSRLVKFLILSLRESCERFTKLSLTPKENWEREHNTQQRTNGQGTKGSTLTPSKIMNASTKTGSLKLRQVLEKVLKFCKLLSLLTSKSPIIGGPLGESGGLDLVLDLYFCLAKRFPLNLRLGALSSIVGEHISFDHILPGEAIKTRDMPLKVLPCILPSSCICRVAQACLMDHCMSPQKQSADFAWPSANDWKALCPVNSDFNRLHNDEHFGGPLEGHLELIPDFKCMPKVQQAFVVNSPQESTYATESASGGLNLSSGSPLHLSKTAVINSSNIFSQVEGTPSSHLLRPKRPFVPRLLLNSLKSPTSRFGQLVVESKESRTLPIPGTGPDISQVPSASGVPTLEFEIFSTVCNVKFELIQTMSSLFSNHSPSLSVLTRKLLQKIQAEKEDQLVLRFLPDIIGGFLNIVPESTSRRTKRMLFQLISLLDKIQKPDDLTSVQSSCEAGKPEKFGGLPGNVPGSQLSSEPRGFLDILLLEVGERLRVLVHHLTQMLTKQEVSNTKQIHMTTGLLESRDLLLQNQTISSGYLLSLWVDVGLLLKVLGDFVLLWPERGSVQFVLKSCGRQVESVISLLSEYSSKSNWSLAHIMTMQYLLKLFTVCMKNTFLEKSPDFQMWSETDTYFWQLLVMNDLHWNCVKSFTSWVVLESCEGCLRNLVEGYQKVLWEPLEIYYSMLGEQVCSSPSARNFSSTVHGVEISRRSIFPFLRVSILMLKKRLKCQSQSTQQCPNLYMGRLIFLLDFLMNPKEGLLMSVIRSPVPCIKLCEMESETEALNVLKTSQGTNENYALGYSEPTFQVNPESLYANHGHAQSRKCATTPCTKSFVQKFTSCIKQESLCTLADIFTLKSLEHHDEPHNLCLNPQAQNPFLFGKYVTPFLKVIFLYFLKSYNKKAEHSEQGLISPLSQQTSGYGTLSRNTGHQSSECRKEDDRYSGPGIHLTGNSQDTLFCSIHNEDDLSSASCMTYGKVLLALSQNQTGEVSQSFQQMRVMNFLVHQLSLEYEVSQLATPRDIELAVGLTTPGTLKEGDGAGDFEPMVPQPRAAHCGGRAKAHNLGDQVQELKGSVHDDVKLGGLMLEPIPQSVQNLKDALEPRIPASALNWVSPGKATSSKDWKAYLDHEKLSANELPFNSSRQSRRFHVGFDSARDWNPTKYKRFQLDSNVLKHSAQDFLLADHKRMILSKAHSNVAVAFRQRDDNTIFEKRSLSARGTHCTCTSSQQKYEAGAMSKRSSRMTNESDASLLVSRAQLHISEIDSEYGDQNTWHCGSPQFEASAGVQGCQYHKPDGRECGISTPLSGPTLRYTGRFFDLNEEVDRELAAEEYLRKTAQEDDDLEKSSSAPLDRRSSTSYQSSDSESSELGSRSGQECRPVRPAIPRLNLSKSVRKGGPSISCDTVMDIESIPFTTSTIESKSRLSSLQNELQKEVVDFDTYNKSCGIGASYETKRLQRRLYRHTGLHVLLLELFVSLMLTPQGSLDPFYSDRYPMENCKLNAPFFLSYHLNHAANIYLLPSLSKRMKDFKPAAFRILKLTWRALFDPRIYTNRVRIARGALSQVYTAKMKRQCKELEGVTEERVVLKIVDVPKGPHDPCKFFDVYSEVEILEKFLGDPAVCQILDYGVDTESFILVLKHYKCSLHTWRQGHIGDTTSKAILLSEIPGMGVVEKFVLDRLPLYLEVYSAVLHAVKALEIENVVHYDLKCDNILLEPVDPICSEADFWSPMWPPVDPSKPLPFRICIADFGQSKASMYLGGECTVRNRGTEYVKSPEMLKLLSSQSQRDSDFNLKSRDEGVGKAVDVWSLGCLLYELLTGEYLFYDEDWLQFFMRVTLPSEELITKEKAAKLEDYAPVVDLLRFILIRDPLQRPTLDEVAICVEQLQLKVEEQAQTRKGNADELPSKIQVPFEEDSDTDGSFLDELGFSVEREIVKQVASTEIQIVPTRVWQKASMFESLKCFTKQICHCKCGGE